MPSARLEHANLTVSDPERSAAFLKNLCGWYERWRGPSLGDGWTIHVGNDFDYLALYNPGTAPVERYAKGRPLNHVALVVDDLAAAEQIVIAAGLIPFSHGDYEPGRRFYFFDWDGIEFELVSYD